MRKIDRTLDNLLALDGEHFVINESLGLWVKFEVIETTAREQGIKYSLSLHDKSNMRIMGFDNSHEIEYGAKKGVKAKRTFDHWHYDSFDKGRPYEYVNAVKLLEDFWIEVDKRVEMLKEKLK